MNQRFRYSAYENQIIRPFQTFNDIFNNCKLMVNEDEGFLEDPNIFVEGGIGCLRLQLKIDKNLIEDELASKASRSTVNVFIRDIEGSKNYKKLFSQNLDRLEYKELDLIEELPSNFLISNAQIVLTLVNEDDGCSFERLASKTFKFLVPAKLSFPKISKVPMNLPKRALISPFALKWIGEDLDKPINQLVELWLNKEHELAMQKFEQAIILLLSPF